jgi:hypothetical protein
MRRLAGGTFNFLPRSPISASPPVQAPGANCCQANVNASFAIVGDSAPSLNGTALVGGNATMRAFAVSNSSDTSAQLAIQREMGLVRLRRNAGHVRVRRIPAVRTRCRSVVITKVWIRAAGYWACSTVCGVVDVPRVCLDPASADTPNGPAVVPPHPPGYSCASPGRSKIPEPAHSPHVASVGAAHVAPRFCSDAIA